MGSPARAASARLRRSWNLRALAGRATIDAHPTATIGRAHVAGRGRPGRLIVGAGSVIEDGVVLRIHDGGTIELGERVLIRRGAVLNVTGHLRFEGRNLVSWYSVVHCAESVVFEELAGTGEHVTVVDSNHFHGDPGGGTDEHWLHNNRTDPVVIGRNTWLAAHCSVTAGARLGARSTVATQAVVRPGTYPDGATLVGAPARVLDRSSHEGVTR